MSAWNRLPNHSSGKLSEALAGWRRDIGADRVLAAPDTADYETTCIGEQRRAVAVLRPTNEQDISRLVRTAARCGVPLFPVSTGKNWGYGSAAPVNDDCAVVDLSGLNQIVEVDPDLGLVTLQPGVTQQQLYDYLELAKLPFMVPVTGAGPHCSLLGNALERGYGITPHADHFAAVTALRAILPNGDPYCSGLRSQAASSVDAAHKWGVGPYLDGLFSQSGFGIVTEMTLALARKPEHIELFVFELARDEQLGPAVEAVRELMQGSGLQLSGINLMNRARIDSMRGPDEAVPSSSPAWIGIGAVYGPRRLMRAARQHIRSVLRPLACRLRFINQRRLELAQALLRLAPRSVFGGVRDELEKVAEALAILAGKPTEMALRLVYTRGALPPPAGGELDPRRDGAGLMWYAPLVPFRAADVQRYVNNTTRVLLDHGFAPLITLTTISDSCCDSTVPLVFDRHSELDRAEACFDALVSTGTAEGFLPYRWSIRSMRRPPAEARAPFWQLVHQLKQAVDPQGILAPGRYDPLSLASPPSASRSRIANKSAA